MPGPANKEASASRLYGWLLVGQGPPLPRRDEAKPKETPRVCLVILRDADHQAVKLKGTPEVVIRGELAASMREGMIPGPLPLGPSRGQAPLRPKLLNHTALRSRQ